MSAVKILREDPCSPDFKPLEEATHAWEIRRSDPKESHRRARQLIEHALEFDQPLVTAWAYLTCAAHEVAANELDEAEESLESAKTLFTRADDARGVSLADILFARVQMARADFRAALASYKSIMEREAHGLHTLERFEAFNSIAGCFWGLDNIELCLLYLTKAFDSLRNTSFNTERAAVLSNMAAALLTVGNYEGAQEFLSAAEKFSAAGTDRVLQLNILTNLVSCHVELKNVAEGMRAASRILGEYQDLAFSGPTNSALSNAAMAFALGKQYKLAEQCLVGAQIIAEESRLPFPRFCAAQAEAIMAETRGSYAVAAAQAESILERFDEEISNENRSQIYSLLASCYQRLSRLDDLLIIKKKKLGLLESRYQAGLTAAMVILDFKSALKRLAT
jgi:tetratricopeptide (TPR) repeat protein